MQNEKSICPVCRYPNALRYYDTGCNGTFINCPVCGYYLIENMKEVLDIKDMLEELLNRIFKTQLGDLVILEKVALVRRYVYVNAKKSDESLKNMGDILVLDNQLWSNIIEENFPTPLEQFYYFIKFLGNTLSMYYHYSLIYKCGVSKGLLINKLNLISATASVDDNNLLKICNNAKDEGLITINKSLTDDKGCLTDLELDLTLKGWKRFEELKTKIV
jgi:hypothetical protein